MDIITVVLENLDSLAVCFNRPVMGQVCEQAIEMLDSLLEETEDDSIERAIESLSYAIDSTFDRESFDEYIKDAVDALKGDEAE